MAGVKADLLSEGTFWMTDNKLTYWTTEQAVSWGHWDRKEVESVLGDPWACWPLVGNHGGEGVWLAVQN